MASRRRNRNRGARTRARSATRPASTPAATVATGRRGPRLGLSFFRDTISELRKVTWPSREEVTKLTTIVIIVGASVGLSLGLIDFIFSRLVNSFLMAGN